MEEIFLGKTFDDFLVKPQFGIAESRKNIDLTMPISRKINISLPIVGANMDTITGRAMMETLSLEGGFGFLHRNCTIEAQASMVKDIKRQHSFIIDDPVAVPANFPVIKAKEITKKCKISGLLVETKTGSGILAGILSNRDMSYEEISGLKYEVKDLMTKFEHLVVASPDISIEKAEKIMSKRRVEKLPLIDRNRNIKGLITMKDLLLSKQKPYSSKDKRGRLLVGAAIGAIGDYLERAAELIKQGVDCILIDVAHGHSAVMERAIDNFRAKFNNRVQLICGNVATFEGAMFLKNLGADGIKVGIGPGRGCRTRLETGFGVPQLQAIREAYLATQINTHEDTMPIIADGGMNNDKDIFLAIACGASTVMLGNMLSGTDESPGEIIDDPATRQKIKFYRGMTSPEAILANAKNNNYDRLATPAEGQMIKVPYVGGIAGILRRISGHLKSAVSYAGEDNLRKTHEKISLDPKTYLIPLSQATQKESFER